MQRHKGPIIPIGPQKGAGSDGSDGSGGSTSDGGGGSGSDVEVFQVRA
jgi:hypothetical protein